MPRQPKYFLTLFAAVVLALRLAGPQVVDEFSTIFVEAGDRDYSAQSRLDLWGDCLKVMRQHPVLGVGPAHWPLIVQNFGWNEGKEAHSLWLQIGAEVGIPGLVLLVTFYGLTTLSLWRLARARTGQFDPFFAAVGCMVISGVTGFAVSAQFVSLWGLEVPFYVVLLGAGALKVLGSQTSPSVVLASSVALPRHPALDHIPGLRGQPVRSEIRG